MKKQRNLSWQDIIPPEDVDPVRDYINRMIESYLAHESLFSTDQDRSMLRDFGYPDWLRYYQEPPDVLFVLAGNMMLEAAKSKEVQGMGRGRFLVSAVKKALERKKEIESDEKSIAELQHYLASQHLPLRLGLLAVVNSYACRVYFNVTVDALIQAVQAGDDDALFDLVSVDHAFLYLPEVEERVREATLFNDEEFLASLGYTMSFPPVRTELAKRKNDLFLLLAWDLGFEEVGLEQFSFFLHEIGFHRYQELSSLRKKLNRLGISTRKTR